LLLLLLLLLGEALQHQQAPVWRPALQRQQHTQATPHMF
jgi:hypothetical protein